MSFAEDVKNELCQFKTEDAWASKVEASCLLRMGGSILLGMQGRVGVRLVTANNAVARRVLGIIKEHVYVDGRAYRTESSCSRGVTIMACGCYDSR